MRSLPRYKRGNFDSKVFIEGKCTLGKTEHAGGYVWKTVNNGCVSDDFCECKMDNVGVSIGCRSDLHNTGYVNRTYCPYCGKKIKIVGE